jgi:hypothetical protein
MRSPTEEQAIEPASDRFTEVRFSDSCKAPAEAVYDLLADLRTHLQWGGRDQTRVFRLLSLDAVPEPATPGTVFTSTGAIPGSVRRWQDRSEVTQAVRPSLFEFVTEATAARGPKVMAATYRHRYELLPTDKGCRVSYSCRQERIAGPMLRLRLPVIRAMAWRVGIPMMMRRGFRNLLRLAEQQVHEPAPTRGDLDRADVEGKGRQDWRT